MTLQVQHPVADWYLAFDDLWELMRVNWHTHNTFTQSGMWDADQYNSVIGVLMVVDRPPYRGVVLEVQDGEGVNFAVITTYGPKCNECGYQPYNAVWFGDEDENAAIEWGGQAIAAMLANAIDNPPERLHTDECSHLTYPDEEDEDEEEEDDAPTE